MVSCPYEVTLVVARKYIFRMVRRMAKTISLAIDGGLDVASGYSYLTFTFRKKLLNECSEMFFFRNRKGRYCEFPKLADCEVTRIAKAFQNVPGIINTSKHPIYISEHEIKILMTDESDLMDIEYASLQILQEVFNKPLKVKRAYKEG